jgi:hypothetical protein
MKTNRASWDYDRISQPTDEQLRKDLRWLAEKRHQGSSAVYTNLRRTNTEPDTCYTCRERLQAGEGHLWLETIAEDDKWLVTYCHDCQPVIDLPEDEDLRDLQQTLHDARPGL